MILLDTDILIEIVDRQSDKGVGYVNRILESGETYCTSSINFHELMYGINKYSKNGKTIHKIPVISYTKEDGGLSSRLELLAEQMGKSVPRMDAMIASVAINNGYHLYTLDNHFRILKDSGLMLFE